MQRDGCSVIGTQIERIKADWSLRSDNGTRITRVTRIARRDGCSVIGTQIERISADLVASLLLSHAKTPRRKGWMLRDVARG